MSTSKVHFKACNSSTKIRRPAKYTSKPVTHRPRYAYQQSILHSLRLACRGWGRGYLYNKVHHTVGDPPAKVYLPAPPPRTGRCSDPCLPSWCGPASPHPTCWSPRLDCGQRMDTLWSAEQHTITWTRCGLQNNTQTHQNNTQIHGPVMACRKTHKHIRITHKHMDTLWPTEQHTNTSEQHTNTWTRYGLQKKTQTHQNSTQTHGHTMVCKTTHKHMDTPCELKGRWWDDVRGGGVRRREGGRRRGMATLGPVDWTDITTKSRTTNRRGQALYATYRIVKRSNGE